MKNSKFPSMAPHCHIWFCLILYVSIFTDAQTSPQQGLLCISDCSTCPVICSPPPSAVNSNPSPPPPTSSHLSPPCPPTPTPPLPLYSPSQPYFRAPPPSFMFPLPLAPAAAPPPPPKAKKTPPPSSISWGNNAAPPPPSIYYGGGGGGGGGVNVPSVQVPPGMGQKNYSYPYYYFYTTNESSTFRVQGSSAIFVLFLCIHILYFS